MYCSEHSPANRVPREQVCQNWDKLNSTPVETTLRPDAGLSLERWLRSQTCSPWSSGPFRPVSTGLRLIAASGPVCASTLTPFCGCEGELNPNLSQCIALRGRGKPVCADPGADVRQSLL